MQVLYLAMFSITSLPGSKFWNGITLGLAETSAAILSAVVLRYFDELKIFRAFVVVAAVLVACGRSQVVASGSG